MLDLCQLIPHCKKESKLDTKDERAIINEVAELQGCTSAVFFEARHALSTSLLTLPARQSQHPSHRCQSCRAAQDTHFNHSSADRDGVTSLLSDSLSFSLPFPLSHSQVRKHQDLYVWLSKTPAGPSVKFNVSNVHTMSGEPSHIRSQTSPSRLFRPARGRTLLISARLLTRLFPAAAPLETRRAEADGEPPEGVAAGAVL